jgi:hypothetical protein
LEKPVGEGGVIGNPIHLTERVSYYFGRSPSNDIELHHRTSSRRHAAMFHHPSGACYLMDFRSAHGTYINGNRLPPAAPVRIRRGSLIRFGGVGAPCFILKSFSADLNKLVHDLSGVANAFSRGSMSREFWLLQQQTKKSGVACIRGEGGMACIVDEQDATTAALVLLNTRLNSLGGIATLTKEDQHLANEVSDWLHNKLPNSSLTLSRKRTSSVIDQNYQDAHLLTTKRAKTSPNSPITLPPHQIDTTIGNPKRMEAQKNDSSIINQNDKTKIPSRVSLNVEYPTFIYPAAVTPEELSSEEEEEEILTNKTSVSTKSL